jgi:hypothetical protein
MALAGMGEHEISLLVRNGAGNEGRIGLSIQGNVCKRKGLILLILDLPPDTEGVLGLKGSKAKQHHGGPENSINMVFQCFHLSSYLISYQYDYSTNGQKIQGMIKILGYSERNCDRRQTGSGFLV